MADEAEATDSIPQSIGMENMCNELQVVKNKGV
jgi:hypothetical protein